MNQTLYEQLEIPDDDRLTSIKPHEGEYLSRLIREHDITKTLEVGLAYGCSAAYIMEATRSAHVAIDPYQDDYHNLGVKNAKKLGFAHYLHVVSEPSHLALADLLRREERFEFIFIDGGHKFDEIFVDWYFSSLLLVSEGIVVFHDTWLRSTQTVVAFIQKNRRDYREVASGQENMIAFQKTGSDDREWDHFAEFYQKEITE